MSSPLTALRPPKPVAVVHGYALVPLPGLPHRSRVSLGLPSAPRPPFAVKAIPVGHDCASLLLQREIRLHRRINGPHFVKLHFVFYARGTQTAYLFFEWASYGSLADYVGKHLSEKTIAEIFAQIGSALSALHGNGIVHGNVRPSNILLFEGGVAKLSDLKMSDFPDGLGGAPDYRAPEDFAEDGTVLDPVKEEVWSLGVSLYETVAGRLPQKKWGNCEQPKLEIPDGTSDVLQDLLEGMLAVDPVTRLTLDEVRVHRFFKGVDATFSLPIGPQVVPKLSQDTTFKDIPVCECDEDYTFGGPSWPKLLD